MVNPILSLRAPLFVPANRPERFSKAAASGADAIILDLEDAVAKEDKNAAREAIDCSFTDLPVIVRINASDTEWYDNDLAALRQLLVAAVMLPKAQDPSAVAELARMFIGRAPILALIETAKGLAAAREIAAVQNVERLVFGSVDFSADLGLEHTREPLLFARSELVLASKLAGISAPIDGVTVDLEDPSETESDAAYAKSLGMGGKLCIHPKQVRPVLGAFKPSEAEIAWAKRVLASGDGVASIDGAMVDEPVRMRARSLLANT
jgi:citrate lyase subunit beta/citryl-CoA lyase